MDRFWETFGEAVTDPRRRMLVAGILTHCITDYWNDISIWTATRREYVPPMDPGQFREAFYTEAKAIDKWLYHTSAHTGEIRSLLAAAEEESLTDYFTAEDTAKIKKHLLNVQYNAPVPDISGFTYYPRPKLEQFLADVPEDIARRLRAKGITGSLSSLP